MMLSLDLFWSFRSPYSYLVTPRMAALAQDYDVEVNVRPVFPLAIRTPGFFKSVNPLFVSYLLQDVPREAERLNLPYAFPNPDPVVMNMATGEVPTEQPHIHRLTRLGIAAVKAGQGIGFINEVSRIIWGGTDKWHLGDHLAHATARAGLDLDDLDNAIAKKADDYDQIITANQDAQRDAGHWGVPLMVFQGEPFFGQDRFDALKWQLEQQGLELR